MSAYSDAVLALTPSLYWSLDASTGGTDLSGNGRTGTASGPTIGGHTATYAPITGAPQSCTDLDGTDDKITSTYNPFVAATTLTVLAWVYLDTDTTNDVVWGASGANDPIFRTAAASGGDLVFEADDSVGASLSTYADAMAPDVTGTWKFLALVFNDTANTGRLLKDGVFVTQATNANFIYGADPGNFQVGAQAPTGNPYDGKLAHVAVFESGLTDGNIADLWTASTTAAPQPVIPDTVSAPALA